MNKFEIVKKIEEFAPLDTQEKWDCSGWLVCTKQTEIKKIMLALTVTDNIYEQAKENNCDMIISHHPLFCVPIKYSDIDIYCAHTNMDKADGGTTDTLLKDLGYTNYEKFDDFVRIVNLDTPITINEFLSRLKTISPNTRYINNNGIKTIQKIGFCAGSGSEFIETTQTDAFVTGDLKFHTALESEQVVFDIGHFESEIGILKVFKELIPVETILAKEKSPFIYK